MRNLREYHRPDDLQTALELLRRPGVRTAVLAGGTKLVARRDRQVEVVVDLQALGLDYIRQDDAGLHLGAMTRLQGLVDSPLTGGLAGGLLARTARRSAGSVLRHQATVGGTVMASADSPLACALLALDAQVVIFTGQERRLPLVDFYAAGAPIEAGFLTEVVIPQPAPGTGAAYHDVARSPADSPIVSVTALLTVAGEVCQKARLVAGGAGWPGTRLARAEATLEGQRLSEDLMARGAEAAREEVVPVDDFRASGGYRRAMVGVLARRALREAWEKTTTTTRF